MGVGHGREGSLPLRVVVVVVVLVELVKRPAVGIVVAQVRPVCSVLFGLIHECFSRRKGFKDNEGGGRGD